MSNVDMLIHIDENLDDRDIHELERELALERGVNSACVHEKTRHLVVIDFDHEATRPGNLLHYVLGKGFHAQMIGL